MILHAIVSVDKPMLLVFHAMKLTFKGLFSKVITNEGPGTWLRVISNYVPYLIINL